VNDVEDRYYIYLQLCPCAVVFVERDTQYQGSEARCILVPQKRWRQILPQYYW